MSKDEILLFGWAHSKFFWLIAWTTAGLTALYMWRCMALTFWGESRVDARVADHVHEPGGWVPWVLGMLAVASVLGGFLNWPEVFGHAGWSEWMTRFTELPNLNAAGAHDQAYLSAALSIAMATLGIFAGWYFFTGPGRAGLQKFVAEPGLGRRLAELSRNKFYVDEIYDWLIVKPFHGLSWFLFKLVDRAIIDHLMVHGTAAVTRSLGGMMSRIQSGFAPQYVVIYSIGAFLLLVIVLLKMRGG